jgi:transposase
MLKDDFQQIWVPSWENRNLRQLLWHRYWMVQARTRILNQLQAVAMNEGLRYKQRLWREAGRKQLESFPLAPWASRRRRDLLELLDRLNPTIAELSQTIEQEVEKYPEARRLMTHPGVGPLTALAFVLIIGTTDRFQCGKQIGCDRGRTVGGVERRSATAGTHHETRQLLVALLAGGGGPGPGAQPPGMRSKYFHLEMRRGRKIAKVAMFASSAKHTATPTSTEPESVRSFLLSCPLLIEKQIMGGIEARHSSAAWRIQQLAMETCLPLGLCLLYCCRKQRFSPTESRLVKWRCHVN